MPPKPYLVEAPTSCPPMVSSLFVISDIPLVRPIPASFPLSLFLSCPDILAAFGTKLDLDLAPFSILHLPWSLDFFALCHGRPIQLSTGPYR